MNRKLQANSETDLNGAEAIGHSVVFALARIIEDIRTHGYVYEADIGEVFFCFSGLADAFGADVNSAIDAFQWKAKSQYGLQKEDCDERFA